MEVPHLYRCEFQWKPHRELEIESERWTVTPPPPLPPQDFVVGLSILLRGTVHEKLKWAFNLYDINKDGYITKEVWGWLGRLGVTCLPPTPLLYIPSLSPPLSCCPGFLSPLPGQRHSSQPGLGGDSSQDLSSSPGLSGLDTWVQGTWSFGAPHHVSRSRSTGVLDHPFLWRGPEGDTSGEAGSRGGSWPWLPPIEGEQCGPLRQGADGGRGVPDHTGPQSGFVWPKHFSVSEIVATFSNSGDCIKNLAPAALGEIEACAEWTG